MEENATPKKGMGTWVVLGIVGLVVVVGAVKEFTVEGSPFKFVPNVINVKKGDTVRVTFKNVTGTHDFVIDEFDVRTTKMGEGEEEEGEFMGDNPPLFFLTFPNLVC